MIFEGIVIGGSTIGSFVLDSKYITKLRVHSKTNTTEIWFHTCGPFQWFIDNFGAELENNESMWSHMQIHFDGIWHIRIDTKYIPFCIS